MLENTNLAKRIEIKHQSCNDSPKFLYETAVLFRSTAYNSIQHYSSPLSETSKGAYVFLHTVNANLIEFLRCSMSNAMIKHFVQNFLKGSNPALTYPFLQTHQLQKDCMG